MQFFLHFGDGKVGKVSVIHFLWSIWENEAEKRSKNAVRVN